MTRNPPPVLNPAQRDVPRATTGFAWQRPGARRNGRGDAKRETGWRRGQPKRAVARQRGRQPPDGELAGGATQSPAEILSASETVPGRNPFRATR
jgi:hypothetical protein